MNDYPLLQEYIEAIKFAEDNFEALKHLRPVLGEDGKPIMSGGNFAVVFKMKNVLTDKFYAIKCFLRDQEGREEAYRMISEVLSDVNSSYLTSITYIEDELFVDSKVTQETEFPVLLMDWVEGKTLDKYIRENLDDQYALEMLAYQFSRLAMWLLPQPFAHGDLKPDNIIVREDGTLTLVDYDGMYVPAMKGQKARELGSPDFRHPSRTAVEFNEHIDDFPIASILLSLKAISLNPQLLNQYGAPDRLLLFKDDYSDLSRSVSLSGMHQLMSDYGFAKAYSLFLLAFSQNRLLEHDYSLVELDSFPNVVFDYAEKLRKKGLLKEAFDVMLPIALKGNPQAQSNIGWCYMNGVGCVVDYVESEKWLTMAANQNWTRAICDLGILYWEKKDYKKAFLYYYDAAERNYPEAKYYVARCYLEGLGTEINETKGLEWLYKAAEQKDKEALFCLGESYEKGYLVDKDESKAFYYYLESAKQGDSDAQNKLGYIYRKGSLGQKESPEDSYLWFFKAAVQGDSSSQFLIGLFYASGYGVEKDYKKAVEWYRRAAKQNNKGALNNLGVCYQFGRGVEIDLSKATSYYEKSAKLGNIIAQRNLSNCYHEGKGVDKNKEKAFYWRLQAAKNHDVSSQEKIAEWFFKGFGVNQDREQALIWYVKSKLEGDKKNAINVISTAIMTLIEFANNGDVACQYYVGKCYEYGVGVEKDIFEANKWFVRASDNGHIESFIKLRRINDINTEVNEEENKNAVEKDTELGIYYSRDHKKTIGCGPSKNNIYSIKQGTRIICDFSFEYSHYNGTCKIIIPSSIVSIGKNPFAYPSSWNTLNAVILENKSKSFKIVNDALLTKDGKRLICYFGSNKKSYKIPRCVEIIGDSSFKGNKDIEKITFPPLLKQIEDKAFMECWNLKVLDLPESTIQIGEKAFYGCESLNMIASLGSVDCIEDQCFMGCNLSSVSLPNSLEAIKENAFNGNSNLKEIVIPNGVLIIGKNAFAYCGLNSVTLSEELREIGDLCFFGCPIIKLSIPSHVKSVGVNPFVSTKNIICECNSNFKTYNNSLINIRENSIVSFFGSSLYEIPQSISMIKDYSFTRSNITKVKLGRNVRMIGEFAFSECHNLETIEWEEINVKSLPAGLFYDCESLRDIIIPKSVKEISKGVFTSCNSLTQIYFKSNYVKHKDLFYAISHYDYAAQYYRSSRVHSCIAYNDNLYYDLNSLQKLFIYVPEGCTFYNDLYGFHSISYLGWGERNIIIVED